MLTDVVLYTLIGYLSGSVLYSLLYVKMFKLSDIRINSRDHNPGVANAFKNGGFACGTFTLVGDFFKVVPSGLPLFAFDKPLAFVDWRRPRHGRAGHRPHLPALPRF